MSQTPSPADQYLLLQPHQGHPALEFCLHLYQRRPSLPPALLCAPESLEEKRKLNDVDKALLDTDRQINQCQDLDDDEVILCSKLIAAKLSSFSPYQFALACRNIESILFDIQYTGNTNETRLQQSTSHTN